MILSDLIFENTGEQYWFFGQVFVFFFLVVYLFFMCMSYKNAEIESQKEIAKGFSLFIVSTVLSQGFFLLEEYFTRAGYEEVFPRYIRIGGTGYEYIMMLLFACGFIFLMRPIEKYILFKEKLVRTRLNIIALILLIIPYCCSILYNEGDWINYWTIAAYPGLAVFSIAALISIFGSFFFYLRLGTQGTGLIKKKGYLIGFGLIFMYLALIGGSTIASEIGGWLGAITGPGIMIVGSIMVIIGQQIKF